MKLNRLMRKYWLPVLIALIVAIVILNYRTSNFTNALAIDCVNSVNELYYEGKCYRCPAGSSGISWVSPGYVECSTSDNRVVAAVLKSKEGFQQTCPINKKFKCPPGTKEYNNLCYFPCDLGYKNSDDYSKCVSVSGKRPDKGITNTVKGCYT